MALPKLNTSPKYEMVIPSTQETVRYRPYLVKEEKVLLMAFEQNDPKAAMKAIIDTILVCVDGKLDRKTLKTFDVEYMFTQIRAKSVGETSNINISCESCNTANLVEVNLANVSMDSVVDETTGVIEIQDGISVEVAFPSAERLLKVSTSDASQTETLVNTLIASLVGIQTEEERIDCSEISVNDLREFVESMTGDQFKMVAEWLGKIPTLTENVKFTCKKCEHENDRELRGLIDFF